MRSIKKTKSSLLIWFLVALNTFLKVRTKFQYSFFQSFLLARKYQNKIHRNGLAINVGKKTYFAIMFLSRV